MLIGVLYGEETGRRKVRSRTRQVAPVWSMRFGGRGAPLNGDDMLAGWLTDLKKAPGKVVRGITHVGLNIVRAPTHFVAQSTRSVGRSIFSTVRHISDSKAAEAAAGYFLGAPPGGTQAASIPEAAYPAAPENGKPVNFMPYIIIAGVGVMLLGGTALMTGGKRR